MTKYDKLYTCKICQSTNSETNWDISTKHYFGGNTLSIKDRNCDADSLFTCPTCGDVVEQDKLQAI